MTQNPFQKVQENLKNLASKIPVLDKDALMSSHKRNMEALTEANKMALEVMKTIANMQSQYVKQTFEDMSSIMRDVFSHPSSSKEAVEKHSTHTKIQVEKAFEHGSNVTTTLAKTQKEIFDLMHGRYHEGAQEIFQHSTGNTLKTKH